MDLTSKAQQQARGNCTKSPRKESSKADHIGYTKHSKPNRTNCERPLRRTTDTQTKRLPAEWIQLGPAPHRRASCHVTSCHVTLTSRPYPDNELQLKMKNRNFLRCAMKCLQRTQWTGKTFTHRVQVPLDPHFGVRRSKKSRHLLDSEVLLVHSHPSYLRLCLRPCPRL